MERGWEETWSRSCTEGRLHRESLGGGESVRPTDADVRKA